MNGFRSAREKAKLSVWKAADAIDCTAAAIYKWERGAGLPGTKEMYNRICAAYNCTVSDLLETEVLDSKA